MGLLKTAHGRNTLSQRFSPGRSVSSQAMSTGTAISMCWARKRSRTSSPGGKTMALRETGAGTKHTICNDFADPIWDAEFYKPSWIAVADLDRDGDLDVAGRIKRAEFRRRIRNRLVGKTTDRRETENGLHTLSTLISGACIPSLWPTWTATATWTCWALLIGPNAIAWWENDGSPGKRNVDPTCHRFFFWRRVLCRHGRLRPRWATSMYLARLGMTTLSPGGENNGSPTSGSWTKRTIGSSFNSAACVETADLDGDGDLDVLGAAADANVIALVGE